MWLGGAGPHVSWPVRFPLTRTPALPAHPQERAEELAAREDSLEAWKAQFKAEAVRQIAERELLLTEWQARLDRRGAEVEEAQRAAEVRGVARRHVCLRQEVKRFPQLWLPRPAHSPRRACCQCCRPPQKKMAARDDASQAREKAALAAAAELEERVASFDAKEKKAMRVRTGCRAALPCCLACRCDV